MKDFKGIYGEQEKEKEITYYEHGAHFKYSDLVDALNKLQYKRLPKKDLNLEVEELNNKNGIKIISEKKKKKKYKLKLNTQANNDNNNRYKDINVNIDYKMEQYPNEEKKNENDNEKFTYHLKKSKIINPISKSVDRSKINLPKIVFNHININNNSNINNNPISLRNKSFNSKKLKELIEDENKKTKKEENNKIEILPKLDSNYYKQNNTKEKEYKKTIDNIKMFSIKNKNKRSYNNNINDRINTETGKSKGILNNRIRSIFEIEKEIKKNYLNNDISNIYYNNKNYIDVINNDISNQIYQLKKKFIN